MRNKLRPPDDAAAHDPTDPNLARLLPFGLQAKPAEMTKPGLPMHTARAFKTIMENCLVMEEEASCSLQSGAVTDPSTGDAVVLTWIYAMNKDDKPIIVATVQGKPDAQPGLQVIYGGSPSDPMISRGDFIGALSSGARIEAMELLGCRENCVYGLAVDEHADLATWLRQGDAVGFRFAKDKHFRQMSSNLDGFAAAVEDLPMAARRRIDPGKAGNGPATGNKRTLPTDAPPGMAATAPRP